MAQGDKELLILLAKFVTANVVTAGVWLYAILR